MFHFLSGNKAELQGNWQHSPCKHMAGKFGFATGRVISALFSVSVVYCMCRPLGNK